MISAKQANLQTSNKVSEIVLKTEKMDRIEKEVIKAINKGEAEVTIYLKENEEHSDFNKEKAYLERKGYFVGLEQKDDRPFYFHVCWSDWGLDNA